MGKHCIFFDRDGIANVAPPPEEYYVLSPERLFVEPAFLDALQVAERRGYVSIIVTNQKCVHRGLITLEGIEAIHGKLRQAVADAGTQLLDIYVCPHDDGHPDRKPNPGMLLRAATDHDLDLARSWMIGDSERDVQAGRAAGCLSNVLVRQGDKATQADYRLQAMDALPGFLEKNLPDVSGR